MADPTAHDKALPRTGSNEAGLPMLVVDRAGLPAEKPRSGVLWVLRRFRFLPLIPLLMATGGVVGIYFQPPGLRVLLDVLDIQPGGGTSDPIAVPAAKKSPEVDVPRPALVVGLGKIVPDGEVVTVAPPFGASDARIASIKVSEGDRVKAGDVLAVLDNESQLRAANAAAQATVAARQAALVQTRSAVTASRSEAEASLDRAAAVEENARRELTRAEELFTRRVTTSADVEAKQTSLREASREVDRARAILSRYAGELEDQPDVVVAARNLDQARADLARAEADLERAVVRAPITGTVLTVHVRPGEKPGSAGILNVGDLDRMTVEVEVYQTDIARVDVGQPVEITAEALPRPLSGTVSKVGLEVGRQTLVDADPAANTDARVVTVTVALDEASSPVAARFTNLQVLARIRVGGTS